MTRVAVLRDPELASGTGQFGAIQAVAPLLGVEVTPVNVRDAGEIERAVTAFLRFANGGLIVPASAAGVRNLIITLAARHKLPAIYFDRAFVATGGLSSYGSDQVDQYRRAAGYVDRILKGERPADLPVQAATKFELVINLKIAKSLGLTFPPTVLALRRRGDRMIEPARVHHAARRRGGCVAARGARAAGRALRRIGVLMTRAVDDAQGNGRVAAFLQGLQQLGWTDGRKPHVDPLGVTRRARRNSQTRGRIGRARAGGHPGCRRNGSGSVATVTRTIPYRIRAGGRSGRCRFRRQPVAAGRQRHGFHLVRV